MVKTIIQDKTMLSLTLVVAFFVGGSIAGVFLDYNVEAKTNITNTKIIEDFEFTLSNTSSDGEGEYKDSSILGLGMFEIYPYVNGGIEKSPHV